METAEETQTGPTASSGSACETGKTPTLVAEDIGGVMRWMESHRADPVARAIADRHYNRQKPGTPQFVPPGRCLVLVTDDESAFWITSWPFAEYVKHQWGGAWLCSAFRNEGDYLSSELFGKQWRRLDGNGLRFPRWEW